MDKVTSSGTLSRPEHSPSASEPYSSISESTLVKITVPKERVKEGPLFSSSSTPSDLREASGSGIALDGAKSLNSHVLSSIKREIFRTVYTTVVANASVDNDVAVKECRKIFKASGYDVTRKDIRFIAEALKTDSSSAGSQAFTQARAGIRDRLNTIAVRMDEAASSNDHHVSPFKDIKTGGLETEIKALSMAWEFPIHTADDFESILEKLNSLKDKKNDPQLSDQSNKIYIKNQSTANKIRIDVLVLGAERRYNTVKIRNNKITVVNDDNKKISQHGFDKNLIATIKDYLKNSSAVDSKALSLSIMKAVNLPIIDVRGQYGAVLADIYYQPRESAQGHYGSAKTHLADVTIDHKTVDNKNSNREKIVWGKASIPEVVSRGAKMLAALMPEKEHLIRNQSLQAIADALMSIEPKEIQSLAAVGEKFNIRNNWKIAETLLHDVPGEMECVQNGENITFKTNKPLTESKTIFEIQHQQGESLHVNISLTLSPLNYNDCAFETSIHILNDESGAVSHWAGHIQQKEMQVNQLASQVIAQHLIHNGNGLVLPINLHALAKDMALQWEYEHPLMIWEGKKQYDSTLMQRLEDKYLGDKSPMYTQLTIGARNKDFHHASLVPRLREELSLQETNLVNAQASPRIRDEEMLHRYAADGLHSDRLCEDIMAHKDFQSGFNKARKSAGKNVKDFSRADVKCSDLKGAMNLLFHQFVSSQTLTVNRVNRGYKNTSVLLMKSTLREMVKENMRTEIAAGLEKLYEKKPREFVALFLHHLNARLAEIKTQGDELLAYPAKGDTQWNPRFYKDENVGRSPSIKEVLDYTFAKADYRREANYQPHLDPTAVSTIADHFSGKNDSAASRSLERTTDSGIVKPYTRLGRRTIAEFRSPTINTDAMPFWPSNEFMNRS